MGLSHTIASTEYDLDSRNYKSEDVLTQDVVRALKTAGGCIVRNLYGQHTVYSITREFEPYMKDRETAGGK